MDAATKKNRGQFYTTRYSYILEGLSGPPKDVRCVIEPFAGQGDLMEWVRGVGWTGAIEAFDIEPKRADIQKRDTLLDPPDYNEAWILTNPPYLARNKSENKDIYDRYETNDLYKCFLTSLMNNKCRGGVLILPAGFFFSPRMLDRKSRHDFMRRYKILRVRYFEESVFNDTTTTVVAFSFEWSDMELEEQEVEWIRLPSKETRVFSMSSHNGWIIGGEIYELPVLDGLSVRRHVQGQTLRENEQQTHMTLHALDSGSRKGRIGLIYKKDYVYQAKECSRSYATLCVSGVRMDEDDQIRLCREFNEFIEDKRRATWSLFLPQFRESKEYARKRIPFDLAYRILRHLLSRGRIV